MSAEATLACTTCGQALRPGARFCPGCGSKVVPSTAAPVAEAVAPPAPAPTLPLPEAPPEPLRRLSLRARQWRQAPDRGGTRTLTGVALGQTCSYLAYARAEGKRLLAGPELVRFEARAAVPTAVRAVSARQGLAFGAAALSSWAREPEGVSLGLPPGLGSDEASVSAARAFLEALARRLSDVLGPASLVAGEGATTTLGTEPAWGEAEVMALAGVVQAAGFPLATLLPEPLAALAYHEQLGALRRARRPELVLVVEWGGQALRLSFIERGRGTEGAVVFESLVAEPGGAWFDEALLTRLRDRLPQELSEEDERGLLLFARDFKEQLSRSFTEGRTEHVQYCVIPAGTPPTRLRLTRSEFEQLSAPARSQARQALLDAVGCVGLKPEHLDHVILAGGSGRWYFARELIRTTLGRVPHIGPRPEETIARGLTVHPLGF